MHINIKRLQKKAAKCDLDIITQINADTGQRVYIIFDTFLNEEIERVDDIARLRDRIDALTAPLNALTIHCDNGAEIMVSGNMKI